MSRNELKNHEYFVTCSKEMIKSNASQVVFYEDNCFSTILNNYRSKSKTDTRSITVKEMNYGRSMNGRDDYIVKKLLKISYGKWTVSQVMVILRLSNDDHNMFLFPGGDIKIPPTDADAKYIMMGMWNMVVGWYFNCIEKYGVVSKQDSRIPPVAGACILLKKAHSKKLLTQKT
eukprot:scaffold44057_cov59-Attheya_sp.AAC.5